MADLLIKGMEIPKDCLHCSIDKVWCDRWGAFEEYNERRHENCPLVEVPTHGRLIDADELLNDVRKNSESYFADDFAHEWVDRQPTVIEASEDSEQDG